MLAAPFGRWRHRRERNDGARPAACGPPDAAAPGASQRQVNCAFHTDKASAVMRCALSRCMCGPVGSAGMLDAVSRVKYGARSSQARFSQYLNNGNIQTREARAKSPRFCLSGTGARTHEKIPRCAAGDRFAVLLFAARYMFLFQRGPCGVSSMIMPFAASISRISSERLKFFAFLASARSATSASISASSSFAFCSSGR